MCICPTKLCQSLTLYRMRCKLHGSTRHGHILHLILTTNNTLIDKNNCNSDVFDNNIIKCVVDTNPGQAKKAPRKSYRYRKAVSFRETI